MAEFKIQYFANQHFKINKYNIFWLESLKFDRETSHAKILPIFLLIFLIEHSENKIITQSGLFENEIGPGVLQPSAQQTGMLQEYQRNK